MHGFAGRCLTTRPLHRWGLMPLHLRADDGIRTRDPHLGKVMRYQLRYIRAPRTTRRPSRRTTIVLQSVAAQISTIPRSRRGQNSRCASREIEKPWPVDTRRMPTRRFAFSAPADRLAVVQYFVRAEGSVACADELSLLAGRERDPMPVVEFAVRGSRGAATSRGRCCRSGPSPGRSCS